MFDSAAITAQRQLWSLQGRRNTWFCGAYFGAGFHEDGLQAGLAVAEALGGVRRPWTVANESGRIVVDPEPCSVPISRVSARGAGRMSFRSALYVGSVMHRRLRPRRHRLRYRVFWLLLDLDEIDDCREACGCSRATASTSLSFHDADHGDGSDRPLRGQVEQSSCAKPASRLHGGRDPAALHAADVRLRLQSAEHLFLLPTRRLACGHSLRSPQHIRPAPLLFDSGR